jgi:hypothetical protein
MKVLAVTNSVNSKIELILCNSTEEAINKMKKMFKKKCSKRCDLNNTYLDEEECYAQVVNGLEQVEFRIGNI